MAAFSSSGSGNLSDSTKWTGAAGYPGKIMTVSNCTSGTGGVIRVTFTAAHPFIVADVVDIAGVVGTTEANSGSAGWTIGAIDVVSNLWIELTGSTFTNAYISGGDCTRRDTATIATGHAITGDVSARIGTSGALATAAITINGTGSLTMNSGTTLTFRGDIAVAGATAQFVLSAGSTLRSDSSLSSTPTTINYGVKTTGSSAKFIINGTSGSHCTVNSVTANSALFGFHTNNASVYNGCSVCTYCDFTNWGSSTLHALQMFTAANGNNGVYTNNTFTTCGDVVVSMGTQTTSTFQYNNNTHTGTTSTYDIVITLNTANSGTRQMNNNFFAKGPNLFNSQGLTVSGNVIQGTTNTGTTSLAWASFNNNLVYYDYGNGSSCMTAASDITNCYFVNSNAVNHHYVNNGILASITTPKYTGNIHEALNPTGNSDGYLVVNTPGAATTYTINNNIVLPAGAGGTVTAGNIIDVLNASALITIVLEHNTIAVSSSNDGILLSETNEPRTGAFSSIRANLFWAQSAPAATVQYKAVDSKQPTGGGQLDIVSAANADYNFADPNIHAEAAPGIYTGNTYTTSGNGWQGNFTATPGAHDVNGADPQFIDKTRNMGKWYTAPVASGGLGNATTGTYAGDVNGALAAIKAWATGNPGDGIAALVAWVKAGFAPQNPTAEFTYPGDTNIVQNVGAVAGLFVPLQPFVASGAGQAIMAM